MECQKKLNINLFTLHWQIMLLFFDEIKDPPSRQNKLQQSWSSGNCVYFQTYYSMKDY